MFLVLYGVCSRFVGVFVSYCATLCACPVSDVFLLHLRCALSVPSCTYVDQCFLCLCDVYFCLCVGAYARMGHGVSWCTLFTDVSSLFCVVAIVFVCALRSGLCICLFLRMSCMYTHCMYVCIHDGLPLVFSRCRCLLVVRVVAPW